MSEPITMNLNIYNKKTGDTQKTTILVENKKLVYEFFPNHTKDGILSESQFDLLQRTAKKTGNAGVLEESDLNAANKELKDSCTSTLGKISQFIAGIFK